MTTSNTPRYPLITDYDTFVLALNAEKAAQKDVDNTAAAMAVLEKEAKQARATEAQLKLLGVPLFAKASGQYAQELHAAHVALKAEIASMVGIVDDIGGQIAEARVARHDERPWDK